MLNGERCFLRLFPESVCSCGAAESKRVSVFERDIICFSHCPRLSRGFIFIVLETRAMYEVRMAQIYLAGCVFFPEVLNVSLIFEQSENGMVRYGLSGRSGKF